MTDRISPVIDKPNAAIPVGGIVACLEGYIPKGFLKCDGSILNQSQYPKLYNAIGKINKNVSWQRYVIGLGENDQVSYGNGNYIITGIQSSNLTRSTNAINWTTFSTNIASTIPRTLDFINNLNIIGTTFGRVVTSTNSINWTSTTTAFSNNSSTFFRSIAYGTRYVAVGIDSGVSSRRIQNSTNLINWTASSTASEELYGVTYGNNIYVAVGSNGRILSSNDGVSWTVRTSGVTDILWSVAYGNNVFVAVGEDDTALYSNDGITWITTSNPTYQTEVTGLTSGGYSRPKKVTFSENLFYTFDKDSRFGQIKCSTDGKDWFIKKTNGIDFSTSVRGFANTTNLFEFIGSTSSQIYAIARGFGLITSQIYLYNTDNEFSLPSLNSPNGYTMIIKAFD